MCAYRSPRSTRDTAGLRQLLTPVARPNPLVFMWRWRYPLVAAVLSSVALIALDHAAGVIGLIIAMVITAHLTALVAVWRPARHLVAARLWCVITPYRVRTGCAQAWVHTRNGKIPVVLWTSAQPFGERVWVWCRAGTAPDDLIAACSQLAAACWAHDVQVIPHPQYSQLAAIEVFRRAARPAPDDVWSSAGRRH